LSKMADDSLAQQERADLEKKIQKKLSERQVTVVKDDGVVTIINGSQNESMALKDVKDSFAASEEWEKVKTDFYCIPNLEPRAKDKIGADKKKTFLKKHTKLLSENTAVEAEELMINDKKFKRFQEVQTNNAELLIRDLIEDCMKGSPGVLFRSFPTDHGKMENIFGFSDLGMEVSCQDDQCYRPENDFILLYVDGDKLCIRLIEVKRPTNTPWATEEKLPGQDMVKKCLEQLEKGVDYILSMIPDIPSENLQIEVFSSFPETHCASLFSESCQSRIISAEDVEMIKNQPNYLRQKLNIPQDLQKASDSGLDLLLTLTSRLVGKASILFTGNKDFTDADMMKHDLDKVKRGEVLENTCLYLTPLQRDLLLKVNKTSSIRNFCFLGGSGTGKTQMALAVIRKLITTKDKQRPIKIILASCLQPESELLKSFLQEDFKGSEQIEVNVHSLASLMELVGLQGEQAVRYEVKEETLLSTQQYLNRDRNPLYSMSHLTDTLCKRLEKQFPEEQIIFFLDEIVPAGPPMCFDWRDVLSGPSINLLVAFSPVSDIDGENECIIWEGGLSTSLVEYIRLPEDDNFVWLRLNQRYRSSRSIQEFTLFLGKDLKKYLALNEKPKIDVVGEKPIWMDVGEDKDKIKPALEHMKKYVENDKNVETFLLYDQTLSEASREMLKKFQEPRSKGGFGWKVMEERLFHGLDCDTVFYVGSGHLEAFTRARSNLFIVTFYEDFEKDKKDEVVDRTFVYPIPPQRDWYKKYLLSLAKAAEKGLIRKDAL